MKSLLAVLLLSFSAPLFAGSLGSDFVKIDDPKDLMAIEAAGFSFADMVLHERDNGRRDNKSLATNPQYRAITQVLSADLDARGASDSSLSVTMGKSHRLFNKAWLVSSKAHYELVAIMNRMDRIPFGDHPDFNCGEIRFLYRLAYAQTSRGQAINSRLPMTVNVIYWASKDGKQAGVKDCADIAKDWQTGKIRHPERSEGSLSSVMAKLALSRNRFTPTSLKSVEINLQSVRWPSTIRPDMGGYAEYTMRVFRKAGSNSVFAPAPMENVPDVEKLRKNPALKKELIQWLNAPKQIASFDAGIGVLPEKFLARKTVSIAFHGMNRTANRPFNQIVTANDLANISWQGTTYLKSPHSYLRRLNDMSCVGCHQGRSVAGFHFVGIDRPDTHTANAIYMAASAHLALDLPRRVKYLAALGTPKYSGIFPDPSRPYSDRAASGEGGYGSHCAFGKDPSYADWTCNKGLKCQAYDTNISETEIGYCIQSDHPLAGDPCDVGRLSNESNPIRDVMKDKTTLSCGLDRQCFATRAGFPGGLCFGDCSSIKPGEACSAIAVDGFNECLGRGDNFTNCLSNHTAPVTTRACDDDNPCRDDFICTRTGPKAGACIPPYFLFQLRLDGHPKPG